MENNQLNSPEIHSFVSKGKDKHFEAQMKKVFKAFLQQPKTMLMVSIETSILRANICRYVAKWEKQSRIIKVCKSHCIISKRRAGYYTTNPDLVPDIVEPSNTVKL
jgi:hypothetical protein